MAISPINLGNTFTSSTGTSVVSGISSGLNTQAVINSLVASQSAQTTSLSDEVSVNNKQLSALSSLQTLLTQIQTAAEQLSNPQSPDANSNVFANNSVNITANTSQPASNFLNATAASDTPAGTYTISNISSIATATTEQSSAFTVSPSTTPLVVASGALAGQFNAGTFTIDGPGGSASVTFSTGDDLNAIAADFNAVDTTTDLKASVVTSSTGVYTLAFTNTSNGNPFSFDLTNSSNITSDPDSVFSAQAAATYTLSAATQPVVVASGAGSGQFNAGSYTITGPSGSSAITLTAGDTLADVAADFNAATGNTGIQAALLQTAPGTYILSFTSTTTGADTDFDLGNGSDAPNTVTQSGSPVSLGGVTFSDPASADTAGTDAQFELNGVTITRSTNSINDLISGVTLNLLQNTNNEAGASFTLQVAPDTATIQTAVDNFATAYNNFLTFYGQQTALNVNGTPASSAILYSDSTLRNIYNQLSQQVTSIVTGLGANAENQLSDIGLGFFNSAASTTAPAVDNMLSVDDPTLDAAITSNLSAVENIFGYNLNSGSKNLASFQGPSDTSISGFTVDADPTSAPPSFTATVAGGSPITLSAQALGTGGYALTAPSGSALDGLILLYTGAGNEDNISVTTTNGIAAQMNTFITSALTANTGLLATDENGITTQNTSLQTQITNVTTQVASQRASLLQQFSALEAAISEANSSLDFLNAQANAQSASG